MLRLPKPISMLHASYDLKSWRRFGLALLALYLLKGLLWLAVGYFALH